MFMMTVAAVLTPFVTTPEVRRSLHRREVCRNMICLHESFPQEKKWLIGFDALWEKYTCLKDDSVRASNSLETRELAPAEIE